MSRQLRHRMAAVVLGGLILGAPLLVTGTASAAPAPGRQVTFGGGGVFGLRCRSSPDVESMTVPGRSTVLVVNRTGHDARLLLDGADRGPLPRDAATRVLFRRGTTAVALDPQCPLDDDAAPAMVTASSAPADDPGPTDPDTTAPGDPADVQEPAVDSGPVGPAPDVTGVPHHAPAPGKVGGGARPGLVPTGKRALPPVVKAKILRRTTGSVPPTATVAPADSGPAPAAGVPKVDPPPTTEPVSAAPSVSPAQVAAAEPVTAAQPLPPERPIGLLALIASVCAVGVGVAAIRAFVAERASRAGIA